MSEYYFIDGKHDNELFEPKLDEFKCCETPFPVYDERTKSNNCNCCKTIYKLVKENVYSCEDCKNVDVPVTITLNLSKDERTDWTYCKNCSKLLNYTEKARFDIIETKDTLEKKTYDRFLIVGRKKCGKSTLASKLGKQTGLPIYEDVASNQPMFNEEITKGIIMSQGLPRSIPEDVIILNYYEKNLLFQCNSIVDETTKNMLIGFNVRF